MTEEPRTQSDQLPEEAPSEQVVDDTPGSESEEHRGAGGAGREGHGTGNPHDRPPGRETEEDT